MKTSIIVQLFSALLTAYITTGSTTSFAEERAANEAKGIYSYFKYHDEVGEIEFTYGNATRHRMSLQEFDEFIHGQVKKHTIITHDLDQGTQIEYYAKNGEVSLWYPGNEDVVKGRFYTKENLELTPTGTSDIYQVCFSYQETTINPETGEEESVGRCFNAYEYLIDIKGKRQGDIFNLSSGSLPYTFQKNDPPKWPDGDNLIAEIAPHNFE